MRVASIPSSSRPVLVNNLAAAGWLRRGLLDPAGRDLSSPALGEGRPLRPTTARLAELDHRTIERPRLADEPSQAGGDLCAVSCSPRMSEDALTETGFTIEGIYGGTTRFERTAAWTAKMRTFKPAADFKLPAGKNSAGTEHVSAAPSRHTDRVTDADRHRIAEEICDEFEATLPERLVALERRADAHRAKLAARAAEREAAAEAVSTPTAPRPACIPTCRRCGSRLSWRQRSDAQYCGAACKKASYRSRRAA